MSKLNYLQYPHLQTHLAIKTVKTRRTVSMKMLVNRMSVSIMKFERSDANETQNDSKTQQESKITATPSKYLNFWNMLMNFPQSDPQLTIFSSCVLYILCFGSSFNASRHR